MDNNGGPVTQAQLKAALQEQTEHLVNATAEAKQETMQEYRNLAARLERAETTLLADFRNHARLHEIRTSAIEVRTTGIESRLHELEQRVFNLESHGQK